MATGGCLNVIRLLNSPMWVGLLMLSAFMIRLFNIGNNDLWHDEALTGLAALRPFGDMLAVSQNSNHPPGYYALM